jgi:hypothetical protein
MPKDLPEQIEFQQVNNILAEWNPIGVPDGLAESEYTMYVPNMLQFRNDYSGLVNEMKRILNDVIGLEWEYFDDEFKNETHMLAAKMIEVLKGNPVQD